MVMTNLWRRLRDRSPFEWLLVTPILTLPLSALLLFVVGGAIDGGALGLVEVEWTREGGRLDRTHYFYFDFWLVWGLLTAPGVVNLLVVRWLPHELPYVRITAWLASVLALLRTFVVPVASILWLTGELAGDGELLLRVPVSEARASSDPSASFATLSLLLTAWMGGLGMWLLTLGIWRAYDPLMDRFFPGRGATARGVAGGAGALGRLLPEALAGIGGRWSVVGPRPAVEHGPSQRRLPTWPRPLPALPRRTPSAPA